MKQKKRNVFAALLTASVAMTSMGISVSADEIEAPESITMLVNYKATETPADDNEIILAIEEYTGTKLDITWVPQDAFEEKINTLMASKDLPQITVIRENQSSGFINAARSGMFWDLSPYLDQFENLSQIDPNVYANVQTDGKQYLIPRIRQTARFGGIIRTDWLENLGLEMPQTIDDLEEILRAFTEDDPDGNGQDDTIGISMNDTELKNVSTLLAVYCGGINDWAMQEDGTFISEYNTDIYTDALTRLRSWYEAGYINKDFPINDDETGNFTSGYAGCMWLGNIEDATSRLTKLTEVNPDATVDVFQILTDGEEGEKHLVGYKGYTGCIAVPTTSVETEEELLQVLDFLDKLGDPEMCDLFNYGIEGETYTVEDGGVVQTDEQLVIYGQKYNQLRQITPFYTWQNLKLATTTPLAEKITGLMNENTQYTVFNPTLSYISETYTELGGSTGELETFIIDSITNYVIGELSLDEYKNQVEQWNEEGGEAIVAEYQEIYESTH